MKRNADPIEPEFDETMQVLAHVLDQQFNGPEGSPREVGFVLMCFRLGEQEEYRTNYVSNSDLGGVVKMLRSFITHAENAHGRRPGGRSG